jgi:thymidylate synthase
MFGVMQRLALRGETTAEYTAGMFPLFTTKHVSFNNILREFQWFMRGDANTEWLTAHGVRIWEANTTREYLDWRGLNEYAPGETGPIYGHQWRGTSLSSWRIDQVQEVIDAVRGGVPSRRMIVSAWNVSDLHKMCLPPCHVMYQFYIRDGVLSCMLTQRSSDYFLAGNYNIATCALFVYMICALTGATPGEVVWSVGDCHLYCAHEHAAREQLTREVGPCPRLVVRRAKTIEEFLASDPVLEFYEHQGRLRAPLIV